MCRFAAYLGNEIPISWLTTTPSHSIIHQSYQAAQREEPLNGDGFGLAWYDDDDEAPALFRSITPAWNNLNLVHLARVIDSRCILAHVRAASPGLPVIQLNCHPFSWGELAFMHNGRVGGFSRLRRALLDRLSDEAFQSIAGTTDSEHAFALLVDRWCRSEQEDPLERLAEALTGTIDELEELRREHGIEEPSLLNLALTDGERMVACRYTSGDPAEANTLYVHAGRMYLCDADQAHLVPADQEDRAVLIASEPLTDDGHWDPVEVGELLLVSADRSVERRRLGDQRGASR